MAIQVRRPRPEATRGLTATITASPTGVTGLRWLDAKRIVLASEDGVARLAGTDDKSRAQRVYAGSPDLLHCLALSPDNKRLYGGGHDGSIYVWRRSDGRLLAQLDRHSDAANSVAFDPQDLDHLVSAADDSVLASYGCLPCAWGTDDLAEVAERRRMQVIDLTQ